MIRAGENVVPALDTSQQGCGMYRRDRRTIAGPIEDLQGGGRGCVGRDSE
jgi:hypothetical protein